MIRLNVHHEVSPLLFAHTQRNREYVTMVCGYNRTNAGNRWWLIVAQTATVRPWISSTHDRARAITRAPQLKYWEWVHWSYDWISPCNRRLLPVLRLMPERGIVIGVHQRKKLGERKTRHSSYLQGCSEASLKGHLKNWCISAAFPWHRGASVQGALAESSIGKTC
jgi:hypothetical protein